MKQKQLIEAIKSNNINKVKALIEAGANIIWQDKYGNTALHYACGEEYICKNEIVTKLSYDKKTKTLINEKTNLEIIKLLVYKSGVFNSKKIIEKLRNNKGHNALDIAENNDNYRAFMFLTNYLEERTEFLDNFRVIAALFPIPVLAASLFMQKFLWIVFLIPILLFISLICYFIHISHL